MTSSAPDESTVVSLLERRVDADADGAYLDVNGVSLTAAAVAKASYQIANALAEFGAGPGSRVATLIENSAEAVLAWFGIIAGGAVAVPINTAYKGAYLRHQLAQSGSVVLVVEARLLERAVAVIDEVPALRHVVVVGEPSASSVSGVAVHPWGELLTAADHHPAVTVDPGDLCTFVYTGGTTGPSKGCMLSHNYHAVLSSQIGTCWRRTASDVVWTPLPLYHFNALTTVVVGALLFGGRGAIYRKFSVSQFWPEVTRVGATVASLLGSMAYLLANDADHPAMPIEGRSTTLRLLAAVPLPAEVDQRLRSRFGIETFSGGYGLTEASLISWLPSGLTNRPGAAGVVNDHFFDVRIVDSSERPVAVGETGEIVIRPHFPHVMFEGYWGDPQATVDASRNWWFHTGDIGRVDSDGYLYFVDRLADYLRRRGENISSFEVEGVLLGHDALADVAVHAVPSALSEDDLKVTAVLRSGVALSEEALFRWCIDQLPYFALPRYIEFRDDLPRSPVGRVLKRALRDEGVTATTWDAEAAGITYEKR